MTLATFNNIKAYNKSISGTIKLLPESALLNNEWCNFYKANYKSIDSIAYKMFGSYVLDDVENPLKTMDTNTLTEELTLNATMFLETNETYLSRLWEIESLKFSPIENYDRKTDSESTNTRENTNETKISAFDSNDYQNNALISDNNDDHNVLTERVHGNIGVTTTVQMLEQDTNYWNKNNMYQTIAEKFMFTFMITTI